MIYSKIINQAYATCWALSPFSYLKLCMVKMLFKYHFTEE